MSSKAVLRTLLLLLSLASLAACTGMQGPTVAADDTTPTTGTPDSTEPAATAQASVVDTPVEPPPPSANPAVIALLDTAASDADAGRLQTATASIERALRIEPKNPLLWQKLALLKLEKGDYKQAENFAARSNSWAGANKALQAKNWRIISEARSLRGDNEGAKAALARAKALETGSEPSIN
ncbi:MAG TPA: tetratricopeptide repeat protein [Gammaproteobacteria bacterium]